MQFIDAIKERRSIRKYKSDKVSKATIEKIIEAARYAPSWKNSQTARYTVITDEKVKADIAENATLNFSKNKNNINGAPVLVVLSTVDKISGYNPDGSATTSMGDHWQSFDAGIACEAFCLSAYNYGLGTLIMGIFNENKVKEIIGVPENEKVSALIALGYSNENPNVPKRKNIEEIARFI